MKASVIHDERLKQLADRITEDIFIRQNKEVEVATHQRTGLVEIPVQPLPNMRPLKCYFNVRDVIKEQGGTALFGWAFYNDDAGLFLAQHHAIWRRPDQQLVDVTPNVANSPSIVFMADPRVPFDYVGLRMPAGLQWCSQTGMECWKSPDGHTEPRYFLLRSETQDELE